MSQSNLVECVECSQTLIAEVSLVTSSDDAPICEGCAVVCSNCSDVLQPCEVELEHLNCNYCEACRDDLFFQCCRCSEITSQDEQIIDSEGNLYCGSCSDQYLAICNDCSDIVLLNNAFSVHCSIYCESCYSNNFTDCYGCDEPISNDDICYHDPSGQYFCCDCLPDDDDDDDDDDVTGSCCSFESYTTNNLDIILSYSSKPSFDFHRTIKDRNNLYLGVELELNFESSSFSEVNTITREFLAKKYIFKYDGSIGSGAELVLAPLTYNALKEIDFKKYFKKLTEIGVRGYKSGACGLHVHLSDSSLDFHNKTRLFFAQNIKQISKFSQRKDFSFCYIEDIQTINTSTKNCQRYSAVNLTNTTNEIRVFRSTLFYPRFKSSLIFCCALHHFLKTKKLKSLYKKPATFSEFTDFLNINKQYSFLSNYLTTMGIN